MTLFLPSVDPPPSHRRVLTGSPPAPAEVNGWLPLQMPTDAALPDLAYATALVAACQRMCAAAEVAVLWRTMVEEAGALVAADGAAVVTFTDGFWRTLAAHPGHAVPDGLAAAAVEMLLRRGLLQQPVSIDDLAEGSCWVGWGWRALLVVPLGGTLGEPVWLVWRAARPATLSRYLQLAEAFAHHASLALAAVAERDTLNQAVAARHQIGLAQGILMTRHRLTADQAFTLLKHHSQNTNVKLRAIAQTVIQTGDLPAGEHSKAR